MTQLTLRLRGVAIQCNGDDINHMRFVERNLGCLASDDRGEIPNIECRYHRAHEHRSLDDVASSVGAKSKLGAGLYVGGSVAAWALADWYSCAVHHDPFRISTEHFASTGTTSTIKDIGRAIMRPRAHAQSKSARAVQAMRNLIHFPTFWLLEETTGVAVIHGAAVARDGKALVLTGLDGVGKSTLALYLCQHRGFSLLADNFVLTDGESILPFPEMTRLNQNSIEAVGLDGHGLGQFGNRKYLSTDSFNTVEATKCVAVITNRIGGGLHLETVEASAMEAELVRMWQYLPEFLEYGRFRAVCGYLGGAPWPNDNARAVARLSDSNPCFLLVKDDLQQLAKAADLVEQCI